MCPAYFLWSYNILSTCIHCTCTCTCTWSNVHVYMQINTSTQRIRLANRRILTFCEFRNDSIFMKSTYLVLYCSYNPLLGHLKQFLHTRTHTPKHTHACAHTHIHTHTNTCTHTYPHMHTHTCTHAQTSHHCTTVDVLF